MASKKKTEGAESNVARFKAPKHCGDIFLPGRVAKPSRAGIVECDADNLAEIAALQSIGCQIIRDGEALPADEPESDGVASEDPPAE
jgi:hypothetical protein